MGSEAVSKKSPKVDTIGFYHVERTTRHRISRMILRRVTDGATIPEAIDAILGKGTHADLVDAVHAAFNESKDTK